MANQGKTTPGTVVDLLGRISPRKTVLSPLLWLCAITGVPAGLSQQIPWIFSAAFVTCAVATVIAYFVILFTRGPATLQSESFQLQSREMDEKKLTMFTLEGELNGDELSSEPQSNDSPT